VNPVNLLDILIKVQAEGKSKIPDFERGHLPTGETKVQAHPEGYRRMRATIMMERAMMAMTAALGKGLIRNLPAR